MATTAQPDGPVTLTIRPENVRLCGAVTQAPDENSIAGVVARRAYARARTRGSKVEAMGQRFDVVADAAEGGRFADGDPVCACTFRLSGSGCCRRQSILGAKRRCQGKHSLPERV
ncbi:MAG: hypothetical protein V9H69_19370 [Anaerolineae bacterium]